MSHDILSDPDSTRELTALLLATGTFETYVQAGGGTARRPGPARG
jgi:hypothetical protein